MGGRGGLLLARLPARLPSPLLLKLVPRGLPLLQQQWEWQQQQRQEGCESDGFPFISNLGERSPTVGKKAGN